MSVVNGTSQPQPLDYGQQQYVIPKKSIFQQINLRLVLLMALGFLAVGWIIYPWARMKLSGGIINHGDYSEVNLKSMSSFDMDQSKGLVTDIPARFRGLEGKRVALDGELWDDKHAGDGSMTYFQLVYSRTKCCFSGPPLAQHFVDANVKPGVDAEYTDGMVRVWGTLHIKFRREGSVIKSVYEVDVDAVDPL